ncbi:S-adenosyl-L-methionine-dependent methyltransferase [Neurospora crassa]|uniref:tRNA (uracil(54)-C(5))-methyltransferase n=2 Tax=Neurospora crassa TaxID=5141 RepID=Q1K8Z0_NEUCR|nr:tRNA (uracil-5-)-methyltransferase [Neurospora crassa OR74A]EAA34385.1 tRNA (uracil-5-)-methyltransferase [Neurospora crassa OR74A]KHE87656.1 S-adenosyl-L-methionine-dependent methyltransferase [Neurospora crassa]CAB91744.2 related to endo-exonuclease yNucR [Neurospora crassa]|eukprot:XP_963621.1 tRNA (uracil-5-)-methyltransferase [Neurospora crassa OR74A]
MSATARLLFTRSIIKPTTSASIRSQLALPNNKFSWARSASHYTASTSKADFDNEFHKDNGFHKQHHQHNKMGKRQFNGKPGKFRKKQKKVVVASEGSPEEVLLHDIHALLETLTVADVVDEGATEAQAEAKPEVEKVEGEEKAEEKTEEAETKQELLAQGTEIEAEVLSLSSTGDGLARQKGSNSNHIYVVPFTVPGDVVKARVYRHVPQDGYSHADFLEVLTPSPLRDDSRIQCKYFAKCSGCQFQMLDYSEQLKHKRSIVVKAYKNFSNLSPELVPEILDTIGSPLQYGYRTKLTPHFDGPPGGNRRGFKKPMEEMPPIGFTPKGLRKVMDIEDCPIATDAVRAGLTAERERMSKEFASYTRGATILLRESTKRVPKPADGSEIAVPDLKPGVLSTPIATPAADGSYTDFKTCITDNNATSTEYIDSFIFQNPAGSFFQNNNSILSPFTDHIRQHILPPSLPEGAKPIKNLIDAYSGSGLFTITQSSLFPGGSIGIDIADKSIDFARRNARLNGLDESQCKFIAADAPKLFESVAQLDADETVVVLDPPRKGCDASFLRQLMQFAPRRVVYVSCNVHTQARDVGVLVRGRVGDTFGEAFVDPTEGEKKMSRYVIESIRGFDFFPQTGHVEGVAILNRVDE